MISLLYCGIQLVWWHFFFFSLFFDQSRRRLIGGGDIGVMTALLQEIISVYPLLMPSSLTAAASNRVCNALALLQCVASHNETRALFLNGWYSYVSEIILFISNESSTHPPISISVPQHHFKVPSLRVPASYFPGRYWCFSKKRFF